MSPLTQSELIDLKRGIVERFVDDSAGACTHIKIMEFSIVQRVRFQTDLRRVEGVLVRAL